MAIDFYKNQLNADGIRFHSNKQTAVFGSHCVAAPFRTPFRFLDLRVTLLPRRFANSNKASGKSGPLYCTTVSHCIETVLSRPTRNGTEFLRVFGRAAPLSAHHVPCPYVFRCNLAMRALCLQVIDETVNEGALCGVLLLVQWLHSRALYDLCHVPCSKCGTASG